MKKIKRKQAVSKQHIHVTSIDSFLGNICKTKSFIYKIFYIQKDNVNVYAPDLIFGRRALTMTIWLLNTEITNKNPLIRQHVRKSLMTSYLTQHHVWLELAEVSAM